MHSAEPLFLRRMTGHDASAGRQPILRAVAGQCISFIANALNRPAPRRPPLVRHCSKQRLRSCLDCILHHAVGMNVETILPDGFQHHLTDIVRVDALL